MSIDQNGSVNDNREHEDVRCEDAAAATQTGSGEQPRRQYRDIAGSEVAGRPYMDQISRAGAMDRGSAHTVTIEHAIEDDQGVPADHDHTVSGGSASRYTSAPAGVGCGHDDPTEYDGEK